MHNIENTLESFPDIQDHYPKEKHAVNNQSSQQDLLKNYEKVLQEFSDAKLDHSCFSYLKFQEHKITLLSNIYQPFGKHKALQNGKEFIFSVVQTQFYGLQYIYEVIISDFKLRIKILNLQRQSDTGEDDVDSKELGTGSFGVVRVLKINGKEYAVKRIPFQYKLQPQQGYDYQVNKGQHLQLREALKQYCFFKIFSALGIGPKIVKTNYDLICFNNCIEFKMELCEPLVNKMSNNEQQFNFPQCKKQLYQKMVMLHSLNFVHRDIKPENILFNTVENSFVFGDFGLVSFIKQDYKQKTQTRFAGTPNYCGEQMSKLLNGGTGMVNLYLNDLFCLEKTFSTMGEYFVSHNSRISQNSLSYNDSGSYFQSYTNNFQQCEGQAASESNFTDQTYFPTRNSVITIPTAHTLAPKRYASSINHYQSQIIYEICRLKQRSRNISQAQLYSLIRQRHLQHKNDEISATLLIQLQRTFEKQEVDSLIINAIRQWKNLSRHFGPENIRTVNSLKSLAQITDQKSQQKLSKIVNQLNKYQLSSKHYRYECVLMKQLKNFENYIYYFISYMKSLLNQSRHKKQTICEEEKIFIAQEFIFLAKIEQKETFLAKSAATLVRKVLALQQPKQSNIPQNLHLLVAFLRQKGQLKALDIINYISFLQAYPNWTQMWQQIQKLIAKEVNFLLLNVMEYSSQVKMHLIHFLWKLRKTSKMQYERQLYLKISQQLIENEFSTTNQKQNSNLPLILIFYRISMLVQKGDYHSAFKSQDILSKLEKQTLLKKYTGQEYITFNVMMASLQLDRKNYNFALNYFNHALKIVEEELGSLTNPSRTFDILYGKAIVYKACSQHQKQQQMLEQIVEFLEKSTFNKKYHKLVKIYQIQIKRLCQQGLYNQQRKQTATKIIKNILRSFNCLFIKEGLGKIYLLKQENYHLVNVQRCNASDKKFILDEIVKQIRNNPQYMKMFHYQYAFSNFELAMYYRSQPYKNLDCKNHLWRYLKMRLEQVHPSQLSKRDFSCVNVFTSCLIKAKSNRAAIRFLNHILKYIPDCYQDIRYRAFRLMYRALKTIGDNKQRLFYQLTKNKCHRLRRRSFMTLPQKLSAQPRFRALQIRYVKKICYSQFSDFQ